MPNANWSNPTLTSTYTNFVSEVKNRDEDLALQFDGTTSTNIPTGAIRWDSSANRWKKWNGSSWVELTSTYALTALTTTGSVGIGTASPSSLLTVYGSNPEVNITQNPGIPGNAGLRMDAAGTAAAYINFRNSSQIWSSTTGDSLFFGNGNRTSTFVTISTTGQLGVGTSSPTYRLQVIAPAGAQDIFLAGQAGVSNGYQINSTGSALTHIWSTAGGERLRLTDAGRLGIGTSSPSTVLHIAGNADQRFTNTTNTAGFDIGLLNGTGSAVSYVFNRANAALVFGTNNTERVRIDSSGRLLVGSSAARSLYGQTGVLQTEGTGYASSGINLILNNASTAGPLLMLGKSRGSAIGSNTIVQNGDILGSIYFCGADGSDLDTPGGGIFCEVDGTPGANDMPGRLVFSTTADGASSPAERARLDSFGRLGIGTSSPTALLHVNGDAQVNSLNGGPLAGFRNRIINGNFDIWQRGTSFTASDYGADRWVHARIGTTHTATREPFALGQTDVPGEPEYFCRTVVSSVAGAGNYAILAQRIEDVRTFAGQQVTISFWAKADATKNIALELLQYYGTGGTPSADVNGIGATKISIGTSWQKITLTITLPSISGKTLGTNNDNYWTINIWFDAGSNYNARTGSLGQQSGTFDIAQVQIEPGPVATPFEHRPIGTELALCQRYYYKNSANGTEHVTANGFTGFLFKQTMRVSPTCTLSVGTLIVAVPDGLQVYHNSVSSCAITASAEL